MSWFKVASFPQDIDLSDIHRYFNQKGLVHRFTEHKGQQELWVPDRQSLEAATVWLEAWQKGEIQLHVSPREPRENQSPGRGALIRQSPITLFIIILGILGYLIAGVSRSTEWLSLFTFQSFRDTGLDLAFVPIEQSLRNGEIWRLLTPTFLHFSLLHIVFNGLWIWEFGRRLERYFPTGIYLTIFFGTAISANVVQYFSASNMPFGGLSGVVYGYLGVLFVAHRVAPHPILAVPSGIFGFMLVWLALGVFGVIDMFIPGPAAVGNGAHLGGLLFGLLLGYGFVHRKSQP